MLEKFLKFPKHMKHMKRMIPEKPADAKVSLFSIARTTGNNALPSPQKKSSTRTMMLSHPLFLLIQVLIKLRTHLGDMPN